MRHLETVSTVRALEEALERRVLDGELQPGEHLREVELAEEYEVGRNSLRAAFDALVHRGILVKAASRGVFVRVLTRDDLTEIYELRTAIEVQASRMLAARRTVPPGAREAIARQRRLGARSDQRTFVEADLAFHSAIVEGAGNSRMARVHQDIRAEIVLCLGQLVRGYAGAAQLALEHSELLASIESGSPAEVEAAVRRHLEGASAWLVEQADRHPEPVIPGR